MTVRELIKELLHAPMDAYVELAFKKGEFADTDAEEKLKSVRVAEYSDPDIVYLCVFERRADFKEL